tara:strand:+ start:654 stop:965 length:312 start_codon:yes stop_codon:yes gene_type:complete
MNNVLKKVKEWLEGEQDAYDEIKDDIGDVDSFDDGICEGRHECATDLLNQIKKWENRGEEINKDIEIIDDVIASIYDDYEREQDYAQKIISAWNRIKKGMSDG